MSNEKSYIMLFLSC